MLPTFPTYSEADMKRTVHELGRSNVHLFYWNWPYMDNRPSASSHQLNSRNAAVTVDRAKRALSTVDPPS
jgi:hypothetical protein